MPPIECPLRVDFAGGWLDVPELAIPGAFVVNCAISPLVSIERWPYERRAGLGGSAAWHLLSGRDSWPCERAAGVGWQDPAIIQEGGLCVWRSGSEPVVDRRGNHEMLAGRMALYWTGKSRDTAVCKGVARDYGRIRSAGDCAASAVAAGDIWGLCHAVDRSYAAQLAEGMDPLPIVGAESAKKYCGAGHGGYGLYLFVHRADRDASGLIQVEPFAYRPLVADGTY